MDFEFQTKVLYVPWHANDDLSHPDVEAGQVSSWNDRVVFVKFDKQVAKLGWEGTTSQACDPQQLRRV